MKKIKGFRVLAALAVGVMLVGGAVQVSAEAQDGLGGNGGYKYNVRRGMYEKEGGSDTQVRRGRYQEHRGNGEEHGHDDEHMRGRDDDRHMRGHDNNESTHGRNQEQHRNAQNDGGGPSQRNHGCR